MSGEARVWRLKDVRYSLTGKAQLTKTEQGVLDTLKVPFSKYMEMSREQLQAQYPLAFAIEKALSEPDPVLIEEIKEKLDSLPVSVRAPMIRFALAAIASLAL